MDLSVLAFAFPLLTSFRVRKVLAEQHNEGRPQLVGSSEPIRAPLGGDVILPCVVQPEINMEDLKVRWWRPDIPVDPNRYVHLHREHQHHEAQTMPSYAGRTEMFADGLKLGNVSLRIRNLQPSDDGSYRCIIPHLGIATTITLELFEPTTTQFPGNLQTPDPKNETDVKVGQHHWSLWVVVLSICILVGVAAGAGGCFLRHKCQRRHPPDCSVPETKPSPSSPAPYVEIRVGLRPAARLDTSGPTGEQHPETQSITERTCVDFIFSPCSR
ncbi:uncharacterized protein [Pseudochaenichthys georgianus]|uniref:uncharacterized protein n=1 Tax=Pseudochaenichthys georgianus TaxID=52239 RepID=UPI00146C6332|nr:uncharacterized protein LOC117463709 [Pseudochaenichthys georgianus]